MSSEGFRAVELSFAGIKRTRYFTFLPREGDHVEICDEDPQKSWKLVVDQVLFGDRPGEPMMEVVVCCSVFSES